MAELYGHGHHVVKLLPKLFLYYSAYKWILVCILHDLYVVLLFRATVNLLKNWQSPLWAMV
jgi:hypothetical protein